jgi:hypothetical protein
MGTVVFLLPLCLRNSFSIVFHSFPTLHYCILVTVVCRLRSKCDGAHAETRFRISAKRTSPFKSAGASVQSATGSWGVCISGSNAGYTMFWGSVRCTGYTLHSPVSPSLPIPCITVCHHISTGLYYSLVMKMVKNFLLFVKHELAPGCVHLFTLVLYMAETFERSDFFTALFWGFRHLV